MNSFSRLPLSATLDTYRALISPELPSSANLSKSEEEQLQELFRLAYYDALNQQRYFAARQAKQEQESRLWLN